MMRRILVKLSLIFAFLVLPMSLQMLLQASPVAAQTVSNSQQVSRVSAQAVNSLQQVSSVSKPAAGSPKSCTIGLYIDDLRDFNMVNKTFTADVWVWSLCPVNICSNKILKCAKVCDNQMKNCGQTYDALKNMEFVNANTTKIDLPDIKRCYKDRPEPPKCDEMQEVVNENTTTSSPYIIREGDNYWADKKVVGVFRLDWDVHNYPFDRHTLHILIEDGNYDIKTDKFAYVKDTSGDSGCNPDMGNPDKKWGPDNSNKKKCYDNPNEKGLSDWNIIKDSFHLETSEHTYNSKFGDPDHGDTFTQIRAEITIERKEQSFVKLDLPANFVKLMAPAWKEQSFVKLPLPASFLKLMAPAWIAFLIGLASFFLAGRNEIGSRMTLLAGALFTVVLNMRIANDTLGSSTGQTLVDKLYITTLVGILVAVGIMIILQSLPIVELWLSKINLRLAKIGQHIVTLSSILLWIVVITITLLWLAIKLRLSDNKSFKWLSHPYHWVKIGSRGVASLILYFLRLVMLLLRALCWVSNLCLRLIMTSGFWGVVILILFVLANLGFILNAMLIQ